MSMTAAGLSPFLWPVELADVVREIFRELGLSKRMSRRLLMSLRVVVLLVMQRSAPF